VPGFRRATAHYCFAALLLAVAPAAHAQPTDAQLRTDWANLARYREENAILHSAGPERVVFMGNSITEGWAKFFPTHFPGKEFIGRGIGGQTTPQMLVRFRQDVVALRPKIVVILAGTNDIAGNTGPSTVEMIVLASVLPVDDYPWRRGLDPAPKIMALNAWMKRYAADHGHIYLDFHSAMKNERNGTKAELAYDGVHPNEAGYRVMAPLTERAIALAVK
jgi:lysophospholipase L1-like esterase